MSTDHSNSSKESDEERSAADIKNEAEKQGLVRYFNCPSTVPVFILKQLIKNKYRVPDSLRVSTVNNFHSPTVSGVYNVASVGHHFM